VLGKLRLHGCIQAAAPNPAGATPMRNAISGKPIIDVPGCFSRGAILSRDLSKVQQVDRHDPEQVQ
jgi:hydrogenase small subunit